MPQFQNSFINVAVINESSVVSDSEVQMVMLGLQAQVTLDFAPVWGVNADLRFFPGNELPPKDYWWLVILDNSDVADALGYHDLTDQGLPLGKVFAGTDKLLNQQWSVTASHELLEMLADPDINLAAIVQDSSGNIRRLYAYEVGDPCESDADGYQQAGVLVSDFVYPAWFESFRAPNSTQFDHQGRINEPFQLLPGGYISVCDLSGGNGWHQIYAEKANIRYDMRPRKGSRRERRHILRKHWLKSDVRGTRAEKLRIAPQTPQDKIYHALLQQLLMPAM